MLLVRVQQETDEVPLVEGSPTKENQADESSTGRTVEFVELQEGSQMTDIFSEIQILAETGSQSHLVEVSGLRSLSSGNYPVSIYVYN